MNALAEHDEQVIREIVAKQLQLEPNQIIADAAIMEDLGADSLDMMEISMNVDEKFNLNLPEQVVEDVKTVGDLFETVAKYRKG